MNRDEIKALMVKIKSFYPRFDLVEKDRDGDLTIRPAIIDNWYEKLGYLDTEDADKILDDYMDSEKGSTTPTIAIFSRYSKTAKNTPAWISAYSGTMYFRGKVDSLPAFREKDMDRKKYFVHNGELFEHLNKIINWQPDPNDKDSLGRIKTYGIKAEWNIDQGAWVDNEGRLWADPGENAFEPEIYIHRTEAEYKLQKKL